MKILHENCDPKLASDTSLPYTAYLIEYIDQGETKWDIAISTKQSDMFDYYWDKYKAVTNMTQSQGRVSPKLWQDPNAKPAKKK
jgi:hypothetical protein